MSDETTTTTAETNPTVVDFKASLPEDIRNDPTIAGFNSIEDMAKSTISAQRMLGGRIPIPSKEASPEVRAEFIKKISAVPNVMVLPDEGSTDAEKIMAEVYNKLGRPLEASRYKLDVPEGLDVDPDYLKSVTELAHKVGLSQAQLKALSDHEFAVLKQQTEFFEKQRQSDNSFLKNEWGNAFDSNTKIAEATVKKFAEKFPEHTQNLVDSGLASNPIIRLLALELGKAYQETGSLGLTEGVANGAKTPEAARQELADIMSNKSHAYFNLTDPGHDIAVQKVNKLHADIYPDKKD